MIWLKFLVCMTTLKSHLLFRLLTNYLPLPWHCKVKLQVAVLVWVRMMSSEKCQQIYWVEFQTTLILRMPLKSIQLSMKTHWIPCLPKSYLDSTHWQVLSGLHWSMLAKQSKVKCHFRLSLKKFHWAYSTMQFQMYGTSEHTPLSSHLLLGLKISWNVFNSFKIGLIMERLQCSGFQASISLNHSWRVLSKTLPGSMSLPLILLISILRLFLMRANMICRKGLVMECMLMACFVKDVGGTKRRRHLRSPCPRSFLLLWRPFGLNRRRRLILTMVIPIFAQFTRQPGEQVLCRPRVIRQISCCTFGCQCRRSIRIGIGSRRESQCWQDWVTEEESPRWAICGVAFIVYITLLCWRKVFVYFGYEILNSL